MDIGFTGTRSPLTLKQKLSLYVWLKEMLPATLHHGDCDGADKWAHERATELGYRTVIHPPNVDVYRAWCVGNEHRPAKWYHDRNRAIVDETTFLVACPYGPEVPHSGTWFTINYARQHWRPVVIVWPDGSYG